MAKESDEKIRIELEVPKEDIRVESIASDPESNESLDRKRRQAQKAEEKARQTTIEAEKKIEELEKKAKKTRKSAKNKSEEEPVVAGYKPAEIVKAPFETPEPEDKRGPNSRQKALIACGYFIILLSIFLWPLFSFWFFILVAVAGAAVVAFATLVRV